MALRLVECVPNFSEGRNWDIIEMIARTIKATDGVKLLDYSADPDHNRSVFTFVGTPEYVINAAFNACRVASENIDLRKHTGTHPRMGATDVIPLVPISDITIDECVEYSKALGQKIGSELNIPVYLYGYSTSNPYRKELSHIRKGEYEGFFDKIERPEWLPDYGPCKVNISAGVTAVGVRNPLIAFNVNLNTDDLNIAKEIAKNVRNLNGGLRYVKALGMKLENRGIVQVSMNLIDYKRTPVYRVLELIKIEAKRYGVSVIGSEIIGLVPLKAIIDSAKYYMQLDNFGLDKILELRL